MASAPHLARLHIQDTVARYNIAGDRRDLDAFVGTFTDDAIYESAVFACKGTEEIWTYLAAAWRVAPGTPQPRVRRHHITTTQIDIESQSHARGRIYYLMITDLGLDHCGFYVDRYRCIGAGWRIAHRQVWMDWSLPESLYVPAASKALAANVGTAGPPGGELHGADPLPDRRLSP